MKSLMMAGVGLMGLMGTGCVATHKYVAKTISPVESRVTATASHSIDCDLLRHGSGEIVHGGSQRAPSRSLASVRQH